MSLEKANSSKINEAKSQNNSSPNPESFDYLEAQKLDELIKSKNAGKSVNESELENTLRAVTEKEEERKKGVI